MKTPALFFAIALATAYVLHSAEPLKPGDSLPELRTVSGKSFAEITVKEITPSALKFTHADGVATVPLKDLAADLQERCNYSAAQAAVHADQQAKEARAANAAAWARSQGGIGRHRVVIVQAMQDGTALAIIRPLRVDGSAGELRKDTIKVHGLPAGLNDHSTTEAWLYEAGVYHYTTVKGEPRTVARYATTQALADQLKSKP